MPFSSISTVLFDLDGTLVDSLPGIRASFKFVLNEYFQDQQICPDEILKHVGRPLEDLMLDLADGNQEKADFLIESYRNHNRKIIPTLPLFAGCVDLLEHLKQKGYQVGIVTSKNKISTMITLDTNQLHSYFEIVLTKDDTKQHKPSPVPLEVAMQRLNSTPEQTVYIGDSKFDMQSAKAAKCLDVAALWGAIDKEAIEKESPTVALHSLTDLKQCL